jgi:hypothetical protein
LDVGSDIVARERIQTSESGSLQVMFLDKTTMTVGPNSDLLIDEFVYDPGAGSGQFAASLTRGALRFVGGQISHTAGATINTPSATIGIRGGGARIDLGVACQKPQNGSRNAAGTRPDVCDRIVCTLGACNVSSNDSRAFNVQLTANQALDIGNSTVFQYSVASTSLETGGTVAGDDTGGDGDTPVTTLSIADEVQAIINNQPQEPAPPPANP